MENIKTIVGEIPTIDFTFFLIFLLCKMGVLNEKRCKLKMFEQKEKKDAAPHNFLFENHFAF